MIKMIILLIIILVSIAVSIYFRSPKVKGGISEQYLLRKINKKSLFSYGGKTLSNIYIPKSSGDTSEIDIIYITRKGIFVFENKNYAGYIFGNEESKNWTVTLYAGKSYFGKNIVEKHHFYNPVWQNNSHIKHLKKYLNIKTNIFSLITFSDRGDLMNINVTSQNVYICNHCYVSKVIRNIWNSNPDVLNESEINLIYNKLLSLTNKTKAGKIQHIQNINHRFNNTNICPACGGKLILRTARKGSTAVNNFYGCSNYPKCRYTKNIY